MAKAKSTPTSSPDSISEVLKVTQDVLVAYIVGTTPMIFNCLSAKAQRDLVLGTEKKTAAQRIGSFKHNPLEEYRNSARKLPEDAGSLLCVLPTFFKKAMSTAALDMPGMKKAQIGRLVQVLGETVEVYGIPKLLMTPVRSADMQRTPDIRTRAIVPRWACRLNVECVQPLIKTQAVVNLLAAAGITIGVGDWRPEKGSGTYGRFRVAGQNDPEFSAIIAEGGRDAQAAAMETPDFYDSDSADLFRWVEQEMARRKLRGIA